MMGAEQPAMGGMLDHRHPALIFQDLVAYILCYGAPLGFVNWGYRAPGPSAEDRHATGGFSFLRALVVAVRRDYWWLGLREWMAQINFFPLMQVLVIRIR